MKYEVFVGDIRVCTYSGFAGNMMGASHSKIYERNIPLVQIDDFKFVKVDSFFEKNNKIESLKRTALTTCAKEVGDLYVDESSLTNVKELINVKDNQKKK